MPPKKKSRIERLKERLYSPKSRNMVIKPRGMIYEDPHVVSTNWPKETVAPHKKRKNILQNSIFRKFFFAAIGFFVLALGFGAFMFFGGGNTVSADNIDINILGNAFVSGGEELPLKIQVSNRNNVALEYSDLILEYQKGSGGGESIQSDRVTVGTVPAGGMVEKLVNITLFGQQGTTRDVNITLEYRVKGSSAIFIKQKPYVVNISSTPINLLIDGPAVTNSNQNISFDITTSLNTENTVKDMMIVVNYPPGFDFKSATPEPSFSDNIWSLGDLAKGSEKVITINGVLVADPGEQRAFNITSGTEDVENEQIIGTQFNSQDYVISIAKPFLNIDFTVNGSLSPEVTGSPGQFAQAELRFDNNLDSKMTDIEITAKFTGNAFDGSGVQVSDGFYDAVSQSIVWNSQTTPDLASVDPGDRGTLKFKFKPLSTTSANIKNPEIDISVSVRGRQASLGNSFQVINDYIKKKIKYASSIAVTGHALYNSGPFTNTGPIPPTPGSPTTYTIVWNVANTTSKVTNAKVRGTLPFYVDWVDEWSPQNQNVTYNSGSREVVWEAGTIEAGVGTSALPATLYFQVKLNPASSQSGAVVNLVSNIVLFAKDSFTGADVNRSMQPITTRLNLDSNYNSQNDTVQ